MHGIRRVLVFCTLTTVIPTVLLVIPLYLRHSFYANVVYAVTESDILEITDGISTIFCSEHTLQMNGTFNAFQMSHKPEVTSYRKHIRLKKSMYLPDDTLEYWGFYLLKGAVVALSVCSRFQGASILVVKGERNLRTCGMLEHNNNKQLTQGIFMPEANRQVKITFESNAQEINSGESIIGPGHKVMHNTEASFGVKETAHSTTTEPQKNVNGEHNGRDQDLRTGSIYDVQSSKETFREKELEVLYQTAETYVQKHLEASHPGKENNGRKMRHAKRKHHKVRIDERRRTDNSNGYTKDLFRATNDMNVESNDGKPPDTTYSQLERSRLLQRLKMELNSKATDEENEQNIEEEEMDKAINKRVKRNQELVKPPSLLDQGIKHGGNAGRNGSGFDDESSISSFENGLFECYGGSILLAREFEPSDQCTNVSYLLSGKHMQTRHNVIEDGYYYYIFYSDNDIIANDIHALFDIYKPTFQYENVTKSCINQTECSFALSLMSPDRVIVEIPTKDGIDHEIDDIGLLVSICHPRMEAYIIFPIAVLFFILTCAFM